jgi:hypothetical protein
MILESCPRFWTVLNCIDVNLLSSKHAFKDAPLDSEVRNARNGELLVRGAHSR